MIRYKINLLLALKNAGYNTNKIRKEKIFTEAQLQQMRDNNLLTQKALNKLCSILNCQPGDILEYLEDEPEMDQE
ncbi:MAG: helix-turn-helix domain-containing protein [Anaeroplasmataceae bacterium]|nr:helix-turn-helix domain-containing protein [Anaeroplasmataceae bacterium]